MHHLSQIGLSLLLCTAVTTTHAATCKLASAPAGAEVRMVAPDMTVNGVRQTIQEFDSRLAVDEVIAWYRDLWAPLETPQRPGSMEQELDVWKLISTVDGDCFTTVQVKSGSKGSYALVSVLKKSDRAVKRPRAGANFPILPGSQVVDDIEHADGPRNARTIVLSNRSNVAANAAFYKNELEARGWVSVLEQQPKVGGKPTHVLLMKKGLEEASIVISRAGGQVNVVANVVDRP